MKKLFYNSTAKAAAVLLLCLTALVFLASVFCLYWLQDCGAFSNGYDAARQSMIGELGWKKLNQIRDRYFYNGYRGEDLFPHTNLRFSIALEDGTELYNNYSGEDALWSGTMKQPIPSDWSEGIVESYHSYPGVTVTVTPDRKSVV